MGESRLRPSARTVRSIAAKLPKDVAVVDAPVRGSVGAPTEGHLEIFVGASEADFERVRPILETLGSVCHSVRRWASTQRQSSTCDEAEIPVIEGFRVRSCRRTRQGHP
jgi:hypothetical protein